MRPQTRKKIIAAVSIIIVVMFIIALFAPMMSSADTSGSLDEQYSQLQKKQDELEQQEKEIEKKIKANAADQKAIKEQINNINANMKVIKQQIDILGNQINDCNDKIEEQNRKIAETQKRIDTNTEIYKQRICALYEVGDVSRLQLLLSSKDISEFLNRYEIINMIEEHDTKLIEQLKSDKQTLENEKKALEDQKAQLVLKQNALNVEKNTYEAQQKKAKALYAKLKDRAAELARQQEEIEEEELKASERIAEIIRKKEEEARRKAEANGGSYKFVGGEWLWPIQNMPGQYISSGFGPRAGHKTPHTGIDIAAGGIKGHPILAANSGTVMIAGYDSSGIYGNYVVIDHGGGMTSLYGHCSRVACSVGQKVNRGDVIAYVGNTGRVTNLGGGGYHLHFQIMQNGTPVNPLNYVRKP